MDRSRRGARDAKHTVPGTVVQHLIEVVQRWHIPPDKLLEGFPYSHGSIDPYTRIPLATMKGLLARARVLTREPGLGYHLGLHERMSTYGHAGLAASSATTLKEAIDLAIRYAALFSTALSLSLRVERGQAFLVFEEEADLLGVRDIILIHQMLGLERLGRSLTGRPASRTEVAIPEPAYQERFGHLVPHWRFGQPTNRLVMDAALLEAPIVGADAGWHALACSLCEKALSELDFDPGLVRRARRPRARAT
jgi:hypothetical protein